MSAVKALLSIEHFCRDWIRSIKLSDVITCLNLFTYNPCHYNELYNSETCDIFITIGNVIMSQDIVSSRSL